MGEMAMDELRGWFAGRIPDDWFTGRAGCAADRDEILVVGDLAEVQAAKDASETETAAANESRVDGFREDTREARMHIAEEAQRRFDRQVSWGVRLGGEHVTFTTAAVPVMTRLRMRERGVLDTLVDSGVARQPQRGARLVRAARRRQRGRVDRAAPRRARHGPRGTQHRSEGGTPELIGRHDAHAMGIDRGRKDSRTTPVGRA